MNFHMGELMTAEIAIMNKIAIALAADSAGTIGTKIYNGYNKLFMLSKNFPVGIMIYDNLDFMGIPWEYIIKNYREKLGENSFNKLKGYADDFEKYLSHSIPIDTQENYFKDFTKNAFKYLKTRIDEFVGLTSNIDSHLSTILKENCEGISGKCLVNGLNAAKNVRLRLFLETEKINQVSKVSSKWQTIPPDEFIRNVERELKYRKIIGEIFEEIFGETPFMYEFKELIKDITILNFFEIHHTGVVIAGFGETQDFPCVISNDIGPQINGKLRSEFNKKESCRIKHFKGSRIIPFAQHEMVDAFLDGVIPKYHFEAIQCLNDLIKDNSNDILQIIDNIKAEIDEENVNEEFVNGLKEKITNIQTGPYLNKFDIKMNYIKKENKSPILEAISVLPKDELALMAESLVDITSLKRKATMNQRETVGGAIDVAVISKGDGFIWIKRKHYFDSDLNHHFFKNWFNMKNEIKKDINNENKKNKREGVENG